MQITLITNAGAFYSNWPCAECYEKCGSLSEEKRNGCKEECFIEQGCYPKTFYGNHRSNSITSQDIFLYHDILNAHRIVRMYDKFVSS